jgi:hypothetical protein
MDLFTIDISSSIPSVLDDDSWSETIVCPDNGERARESKASRLVPHEEWPREWCAIVVDNSVNHKR